MASTVMQTPRVLRLWRSYIGKKAVMATSGLVLFGYVFVHMAANLQFFLGPGHLDTYAANLRQMPVLLWGVRLLLLCAAVLHVVAAAQLVRADWAARPARYAGGLRPVQSSYASRSMKLSGVVLLAFVVFHILHLTTGHVHPRFQEGFVYDNVVSGFRVAPVAVGYLAAMLALCLHLYHGVWSMTQSLGFHYPRYTPALQRAAKAFALVIAVGFATVPVGVLLGLGG